MSKRDTFIEKDLFMNILMHMEGWDGKIPQPAVLKPKPLWTGKQVFTMFLPKVNLRREAAWFKDKEPEDFSPEDTQVGLCSLLCCCPSGTESGGNEGLLLCCAKLLLWSRCEQSLEVYGVWFLVLLLPPASMPADSLLLFQQFVDQYFGSTCSCQV